MSRKKIVFVLQEQFLYLSSITNKDSVGENTFFNLISYTYLAILRMCRNLIKDNVNFRFALVMEPSVCEMLADPVFCSRYEEHLEKKIAFTVNELKRCSGDEKLKAVIEKHLEILNLNKTDFCDIYNKDILKQFNYFAENGFIEILATTGTACFLPLYTNMQESVAAQIEMGLINRSKFFSSKPHGLWLPKLGYFSGLENLIKKYGFEYTILDTKAFLLADKPPLNGIFAPAAAENGLKFLARDLPAAAQIFQSDDAFYKRPVYLDINKDVGFSLPHEILLPLFDTSAGRRYTGLSYQSLDNNAYSLSAAFAQIKQDAAAFVKGRIETLEKAAEISKDCNVSINAFPSHFFGNVWYEGIDWLETVFRIIDESKEVCAELPVNIVNRTDKLCNVVPFFSSCFESGYACELINKDNDWIHMHVIKLTSRMIEIAKRFSSFSKIEQRILNAASKEILLIQSLYWPLLYGNVYHRDFVEESFGKHVRSIKHVYERLGEGFSDVRWLIQQEKEYPLFQSMDFKLFKGR